MKTVLQMARSLAMNIEAKILFLNLKIFSINNLWCQKLFKVVKIIIYKMIYNLIITKGKMKITSVI